MTLNVSENNKRNAAIFAANTELPSWLRAEWREVAEGRADNPLEARRAIESREDKGSVETRSGWTPDAREDFEAIAAVMGAHVLSKVAEGGTASDEMRKRREGKPAKFKPMSEFDIKKMRAEHAAKEHDPSIAYEAALNSKAPEGGKRQVTRQNHPLRSIFEDDPVSVAEATRRILRDNPYAQFAGLLQHGEEPTIEPNLTGKALKVAQEERAAEWQARWEAINRAAEKLGWTFAMAQRGSEFGSTPYINVFSEGGILDSFAYGQLVPIETAIRRELWERANAEARRAALEEVNAERTKELRKEAAREAALKEITAAKMGS